MLQSRESQCSKIYCLISMHYRRMLDIYAREYKQVIFLTTPCASLFTLILKLGLHLDDTR